MNKPSFPSAHDRVPFAGAALRPHMDLTSRGANESAADRILLTLLALGLMLLAFFVVLTSAATFDQRRIRDVVRSVQVTFERPSTDTGDADMPAPVDAAHTAAIGVLRAAVADVFSGVLPGDQVGQWETLDRNNPDRVEIDVPVPIFFAEGEAVLYPLPLLDKLVAVMSSPPAGYRTELVVRTSAASADQTPELRARLAALADGLVHRGLAPTALSVGVLEGGAVTKDKATSLRFSFFLLNADDDLAAVHLATSRAVAHP